VIASLTTKYSIPLAKWFVFLCLLLLVASGVEAQINIDNIADRSLNNYEIRFDYFAARANGYLQNTFYLLALLELTWSIAQVLIRNGGLQDLMSTIVGRIMFIGFFAYLFSRGATTAREITSSFTDLAIATTLTTAGISPTNVMDSGQEIFARMYMRATDIGIFKIIFDENTSLSTPVLLLFAGMLAFLIMAVLAAHYGVILLETFIAAGACIILLALGPTRWTYKYATSSLKYAMSVGMKLFVFTIIMGLTLNEVNLFLQNADIDEITNITSLIGFLFFSLIVTAIVPKSVRGMIIRMLSR